MINRKNPDFKNTPVSSLRPTYGYVPADAVIMPYVSIVTPFFNTGAVFHETAQSVFCQSFQQWEWIIVNDGSTHPEALQVLDQYRASDPRIKIIDLVPNQGVSAAKNAGVREAKSGLIVSLDSDDLLEPTAVEKWLWFLISYPEWSFVQGCSVGFGNNNYLWTSGFRSGAAILNENVIDYSSMIRKVVFEQTGGFDEEIREGLEDWDFWCKVANAGFWGHTIPEYLKWYRTRANHGEKWSNWNINKLGDFREKLKVRYPKLWNGAFPEILPVEALENDDIPHQLPVQNPLQKQKPRILLLLPWMITGGADKFNIKLVQYLIQQGWEVSIITTLRSSNEWDYEFSQYTPDIFSLPELMRPRDYPRFIKYFIASRSFDVVLISNSELGYLLLPYLRTHFPSLPVIDYNHAEAMDWKNGGYPRYTLIFQDFLDRIVVASKHLKEWMVERGGDPEKIEVCYVDIESDLFYPSPETKTKLRQEFGISGDLPVIIYPARICNEKQPFVFAKTIKRVAESIMQFQVFVAGDGPDFQKLKSYIAENQLDQYVRFFGAVPRENMIGLMQAADILFLPSLREGISLSLLEAMSTGLCVVGADVGGQKELVTQECGYLIPRSDEQNESEQYAEILIHLLQNPETILHMGKAGRSRIEQKFGQESTGREMLELIEKSIRSASDKTGSYVLEVTSKPATAMSIEYIRLENVANYLWDRINQLEAQSVVNQTQPVDPRTVIDAMRIRHLLYHALRKTVMPYYSRIKHMIGQILLHLK